MSSASKPQIAGAGFGAEEVAEYLQTHPEFFEQNQNLLDGLKVPHRTGGVGAVSLIERQDKRNRECSVESGANCQACSSRPGLVLAISICQDKSWPTKARQDESCLRGDH